MALLRPPQRAHPARCFSGCILIPSILLLGAVISGSGCSRQKSDPSLSATGSRASPPIPPVPVNGPKLGAISEVTPVFEAPQKGAKEIGHLRAGALVTRSPAALAKQDCEGGWYPIFPRGVVCVGGGATLELEHPTLSAMALRPKLEEPLPYAYARTTKETPLYERDVQHDRRVVESGKLKAGALFAVVGSWNATSESGEELRLGLLTGGKFVSAVDLKAAEPSTFTGFDLGEEYTLPVAFVVKRGVSVWQEKNAKLQKDVELSYHEKISLTGRFRTLDGLRFWDTTNERFVRHQDVTVVRRRHVFPDFAKPDTRWIDVSVVTGTLVLYEGEKPIFATLVSAGRDRLGDPETTDSTRLGVFEIVKKHVTHPNVDLNRWSEHHPIDDAPWVLELASGQLMHAALWHDRFGIEHGPGDLQLSPADAHYVWRWATPALPEGWHGVANADEKSATRVVIRK